MAMQELLLLALATISSCQYHVPVQLPVVALGPYPYTPAPSAAAKCDLVPATSSTARGQIEFLQYPDGVEITGFILGLSPGLHGFHLHRDGNTGNDCKAAGPHFNPRNQTHGGPQDPVRHAGDFGNILALEDGSANFVFKDTHISLYAENEGYAVGRAIVVHAGQDDLGRGNNEESLKTGNAGSRLACCIVQAVSYK